MRSRISHVAVLTAAVALCAVALAWIGWPDADRSLEFGALMLASVAASVPSWQPLKPDWPALRLAFVVECTSLMMFGAQPTMAVAGCGLLTRLVAEPDPAPWWRRTLKPIVVLASLQAAAWSYQELGGTLQEFAWPWQIAPLAGGVLTYCVVTSLWIDAAVPLLERRSLDRPWRSWPLRVLRESPVYFVGASVAAALVPLIATRNWEALAIAAVPILLACGVYVEHVNRLVQERRCSEAMRGLHDGLCVVDRDGIVTFWNDALAAFVDCPRERAIGRPLRAAVPSLDPIGLPRAVEDAARTRAPRIVAQVGVRCAHGVRTLHVKLVPFAHGVTLLWQDLSEQMHAAQMLQRQAERLGLAAEGANDGLWEWDLATGQFFVTGRWNEMLGLPAAARVGTIADWLERVHQDDVASLKEAVEVHLAGKTGHVRHEHRVRHEDGTYRLFQCRAVAAKRANGRATRIAGSLTDTTDLALTQERLRNAVFLDPLTGLCNRSVFVERLGRRLEEFQRRRNGDAFALLYLDLDRFKVINDSLGHLVGDELLVAVSRRLESCVRQGDVLSRLGGDEFAILLNALQTDQQANVIAFRVQETLSKPFSIGGREVFTSASIGVAFGLAQYTSPDEMMHDADTAMYQAKTNGKARHEVFDADMVARARDRLELENDLRRAVDTSALETHYQPIVSLASGMCVGFESLSRWTRDGKAVSPATFIPIAEELGLIDRIGTQVLEEACRTFAGWQRAYPHAGLECITVNVSARQLMQHNFLRVVERAVQQAELQPAALRVEITETALMTDPESAARVLSALRDFGVKIYLDDFGTGYSSLSHLHKLPVDTLKIDRSFVRSLSLPDRPAIVESILALARTLNTSVVAEGIETIVQARELERLGCTHAQGFLFSRPLSAASAEQVLVARRPLGPKGAGQRAEVVC